MNKSFLLCVILVASFANGAHAWFGHYRVVGVGTEKPTEDLRRTTLTVQAGDSAFNRFRITRLRQVGPRHLGDPPVMLIPAFGFPGEFWEITTGSYEDSFAPSLALAGYDVWLIDNRIPPAAPGECESGAVDCSAMALWDQDTAIEDVIFARILVAFTHPFERPVLAGMAAGGSTATATINAYPHLFEGVVMMEGAMYSDDPDVRARNAAFCEADQAMLDAGQYFDPSLQSLKLLIDLAASAPGELSPIPLFPEGTTNFQALLFAFASPDPSNPLNFTETFIRLAGDPVMSVFEHADPERIYALGPLVAGYAPTAFLRDTHCAIGEGLSRFTDNLHRFRGEVLMLAGGRGFGQMLMDTAGLMTSANVTIDHEPRFGESDFYLHADWQGQALQPIVDWLSTVY